MKYSGWRSPSCQESATASPCYHTRIGTHDTAYTACSIARGVCTPFRRPLRPPLTAHVFLGAFLRDVGCPQARRFLRYRIGHPIALFEKLGSIAYHMLPAHVEVQPPSSRLTYPWSPSSLNHQTVPRSIYCSPPSLALGFIALKNPLLLASRFVSHYETYCYLCYLVYHEDGAEPREEYTPSEIGDTKTQFPL